MAFNLVEDSETFEAVLHFVDEFIETTAGTDEDAALTLSMDGLPEIALHVASDSVEVAKKEANGSSKTSISKRKLKYNPNRARKQQRKELLHLREKVVEMEQELKALRGQKTMTAEEINGNNPQREEVRTPAIWKEMATHQLEERLKSERENRRLKSLLERQIMIDKTLAKLLETELFTRFIGILFYFVLQPMDSCIYDQRDIPALNRTGSGIFAELLSSVDDSYREVDHVFKANELGDMESSFSDAKMRVGPDGVYMEMFANKVLPFSVASTGSAAWKFFANLIEHMPYRFFYQKDQTNLDTKGDTVIESFGVGSHGNGAQADFRVKQILRHYVVEDRVVIVWRSLVDLVELSGAPLWSSIPRERLRCSPLPTRNDRELRAAADLLSHPPEHPCALAFGRWWPR